MVEFFRLGVDSVIPAVSTEETRYYLNGAFIHRLENENAIRIVATDGHRLYMRDVFPEGRTKFNGRGIIPTKLLNALRACIDPRCYGAPMRVSVAADSLMMRFALDDMVITGKLIDGTYPDYVRIMPSEAKTTAKVAADELAKFLKGVKDATAVSLDFDGGICTISANVEHVSRSTEIDAEIEGEPIMVGVNRAYLLSVIGEASPGGGKVTIGLIDAGSPISIKGTEKHFRGVMMPMRV